MGNKLQMLSELDAETEISLLPFNLTSEKNFSGYLIAFFSEYFSFIYIYIYFCGSNIKYNLLHMLYNLLHPCSAPLFFFFFPCLLQPEFFNKFFFLFILKPPFPDADAQYHY